MKIEKCDSDAKINKNQNLPVYSTESSAVLYDIVQYVTAYFTISCEGCVSYLQKKKKAEVVL